VTFSVQWSTEDAGIQRLMREMPRVAYKELRELLFQY